MAKRSMHRHRKPNYLKAAAIFAWMLQGLFAPLTPAPAFAASGSAALSATELGLKPNGTADQSAILRKAIVKAAERGLALLLPGGRYQVSEVQIDRPVIIQGIAGLTTLVARKETSVFTIEAPDVVLEEPTIKGDRLSKLFNATVRPGNESAAPRLTGQLSLTSSSDVQG